MVSRCTSSQMSLPMSSVDLGCLPLHPDFIEQQSAAPGLGSGACSGDASLGVQWFPLQAEMPVDASHPGSAFESPALQMFGMGPDGQQIHPDLVLPFEAGFAPQQENPFPLNVNAMPAGEQNLSWGDTLNRWSTAPTGFGCVLIPSDVTLTSSLTCLL
jgi:hypothetical protein